jgi:P4 family phage/plasmid primase-like protien
MTAPAPTQHQQALLQTALAVRAGGCSLVPVSAVSKRPIEALLPMDPNTGRGSWKIFQQHLPTEDDLNCWIEKDAQIAIIGGAVSGGLIILDFDVPAKWLEWQALAGGHYEHLPVQQTGGGGFQIAWRCPDPGKNDKLAWIPDASKFDGRSIAIETRGEGGYAIIAPSLHPSGNHYQMIQGSFAQIPLLSQTQSDMLVDYARSLCEAPYTTQQINLMNQAQQTPAPRQQANGSVNVIDLFNQASPIEQILRDLGYTHCFHERWAPPGAGRRDSVTVRNGKAFHHDTNFPMADGYWHNAFDIWCYYQHSGNVKAAVKEAAVILCLPSQQPAPAAQPASPPPPAQPAPTQQVFHPMLLDAPLTDAGNAECFAVLYGDQFRYCRNLKQWFWWTGITWTMDGDSLALQRMLHTIRERRFAAGSLTNPDHAKALFAWTYKSEMTAKIMAALHIAANIDPFLSSIEDYDIHSMYAGTPHGTLDLRTQTLLPAQPANLLTMQLGTIYDPQATCPRWLQFLTEIFDGNPELPDMLAYIQRAVGYSLTGDTSESKLFMLVGDGNNGKSVFLSTLKQILGDYASTAAFATFDEDRKSNNSNDVAALKGRRMVVISESNSERRLDEERVKQLTGFEDHVRCRFLYREEFEYRPECKIWMAVNHAPLIRNMDRGIWRRIARINFLHDFTGREDRQLPTKLKAELPGILNWALEGLRHWLQSGLGTCAAVEIATQDYKLSSDVVGRFLEEYCIQEPNAEIAAQELYQDFWLWRKNDGEQRPMTAATFGRIISAKGYKSHRATRDAKKQTFYEGLRRRNQKDI